MTKKYNHKSNASNRGDIVKHVFLYFLRSCIFRYADVHSGYYSYDLSSEFNRFKEKVSGLDLGLDKFFEAQSSCYLSSHALHKYFNPSSAIMYLFDICSDVTDSLRHTYKNLDRVHVFNYAATKEEIEKYHPDFVLLDPPGLKSKSNKKYPCVKKEILPLLNSVFSLPNSSAMMWIPLTKSRTSKRMIPSQSCLDNVSVLNNSLVDKMKAFSVDFNGWNNINSSFIGCNIYLSSKMFDYANDIGIAPFDKMSKICKVTGWNFNRLF